MIEDFFALIETEVLWKEPINHKFQLFQFYQDIIRRIKY